MNEEIKAENRAVTILEFIDKALEAGIIDYVTADALETYYASI